MAPIGSVRKARYQPCGLTLHDRTNRRPLTTTTQMPMNRCVVLPARIRSTLATSSAATTACGKRRVGVKCADYIDDVHDRRDSRAATTCTELHTVQGGLPFFGT